MLALFRGDYDIVRGGLLLTGGSEEILLDFAMRQVVGKAKGLSSKL